MNKQELIRSVADNSGLTLVQSEKAINALLESVKSTVKNGGKVKLMDFGTFEKKTRKERNGVKPGTSEQITIPAKDYVKFTESKNIFN